MKKTFYFIVIAALIGYIGYMIVTPIVSSLLDQKRISEIKKGWYVEVTDNKINARKDPDRFSAKIDVDIKKGGIYKVIKMDLNDPSYFWYRIELKNKSKVWIASYRTKPSVKDVHNPEDIAAPIIKFEKDTYFVYDISEVNYDHLTVTDDRNDYKITHVIYHEVKEEEGIDQYWIRFTATDKAGKSSSKTQKIEFSVRPPENKVKSFKEYYNR